MNQPITVLIVDDEFQSRKLISKMLSRFFPQINIAGEAATVQEAIDLIEALMPQLIFLDVQMQGENGFDLLNKTKALDFEVIFITAYNEFAVKAFRYNALDYLMKPVDADEFCSAVKKAIERIIGNKKKPAEQLPLLKQQLQSPHMLPDRIIIPSSEGYMVILVQNILYCRSNSNYTEFYLADKSKLISSYTMGQYEDLLRSHNFFRVHRSYIINLACVKMYRKGDGGTVLMNDGQEIEVSRSYKESFMKFFKE
ncbi:MAG: LytTR family DNA-binding domain-containing protein [Ferruginibacter sp.]